MINKDMKGGDLEIIISEVQLLNPADTLPYDIRAEKVT